MSKVLLLHTVQDADDCVRKKLFEQYRLYSTHSSVDVHLQEKYGITCTCISTLVSDSTVLALRHTASNKVDAILAALDNHIAPVLNQQLGVAMRYATPILGYNAKYHYTGYQFLQFAIQRLIETVGIQEIAVYPYQFTALFHTATTIDTFVRQCFPTISVVLLGASSSGKATSFRMVVRRLLNPQKVLAVLRNKNAQRHIASATVQHEKPTIVLSEPIGEFTPLIAKLRQLYNVVYYSAGSGTPKGMNAAAKRELVLPDGHDILTALQPVLGGDTIATLFARDVWEHMSNNIQRYAQAVETAHRLHNSTPIAAGLWGGPPADPERALLYEYLCSAGIPVVGYQHGSVYGDSWEPWHFDSDFTKCDVFLSYGCTHDDLHRLYPERRVECTIVPAGKAKLPTVSVKGKKKIDILFPLTNSISMLEAGLVRIAPHILTQRQIQLLEYLNSLEQCSVYVKPFPYSTPANCSVLPVLKRCKNLHVVDDIGFTGFLQTHHPRAVLIEFPSTPLLEVLHLDTEVFVMNDSLHPFEAQALEELQQRVHYAEQTNEMIALLQNFVAGTSAKKRNTAFLQHYVQKRDTEETVLRCIRDAVTGKIFSQRDTVVAPQSLQR